MSMENNKGAIMADIRLAGIGGADCIVVDGISREDIPGAESVIMDTDRQWLRYAKSPNKVQLGNTNGRDAIVDALNGARMAILVAGLGGVTGTGAMPVMAEIAKELGVLSLCLVTTPFPFEGNRRMGAAKQGLDALRSAADRVFVLSNEQALASMYYMSKPGDAFEKVDDELRGAIKFLIRRASELGFMDAGPEDVLQMLRGAGFEYFTGAKL